ncbi:MAG TPA: nuclear transport factor 2 family protein [Pseudolabrys sp.]|jgi:hypothetical protein
MTDVVLPAPIDALVRAINGGDTEALMAVFAPGAVVDDWGSRYESPAQIRAWNDRELIGAKGTLTVRSAEHHGNRVTLVTDWKSSFFTGPGRFEFTLENGKIKRWRISEL